MLGLPGTYPCSEQENGITNAGAAALGEALQYNQGLEDLKLKNNTIGRPSNDERHSSSLSPLP